NYKFGGKELQESGMYDFGARNYMPDVGRWFGADPLAELAPDLSPYRYAFNNPISFTDPTGMYEDNYGGGDYYDDSDPEIIRDGFIDTGNCSCNSLWEDLQNIGDWKIGFGGESGDGAYNDLMADMSHENGSNDMMNDAVQDAYQNDGPGPRKRSSQSPNFPGYRPPLPSPGLVMMDSVWDVVGIWLANSESENKYATYALGAAAIVVSKGRATDDVLKMETRVFRAVDNAELASINKTGKFLIKNGGTEAKYFANSLANAHKFGKQLYPNGYTVVEATIYNSNNPMKYWSPTTDGIGAFIFNQKILKAVKPIKP
ncbi:RHS repeat-associated protein, partial [Epilithonimonas hungarica]|uniref:RHS repeat-associated core domain-containing protein n=1 Tax=Epilithonimonas hungarica TaxID=454006 RepID=UPI00277D34BE